MRNVDILLWDNDEITVSYKRLLKQSQDITLFDRKNLPDGVIPDIIFLTNSDTYTALAQVREIENIYPDTQIVYIKRFFDAASLSCMFVGGVEYLITSDTNKETLISFIHEIGLTAKKSLPTAYRTIFINKIIQPINDTPLSVRELAVLGGIVRGMNYKKISKLLKMHPMDTNWMMRTVAQKLNTTKKKLRSTVNLIKYGSITPSVSVKQFKLVNGLKRPGYYAIPKLFEEYTNI